MSTFRDNLSGAVPSPALVRCEQGNGGRCPRHPDDCIHAKVHTHCIDCDRICGDVFGAKCIPVPAGEVKA